MLTLLNTGQTNRISEKRHPGTLFSSGKDTLTKNLESFFSYILKDKLVS